MRIPLSGLLGALLVAPFLCSAARDDSTAPRNEVVAPAVRLPLVFIENRGQFDSEVHYQVRIPALTLDVHADGWSLRGARQVRVRFESTGDGAVVRGSSMLDARANYFHGASEEDEPANEADTATDDSPESWIRGVPTYERVRIRGLRDGMDIDLFETGGRLEYDVRLAPGTSVDEVAFTYEGVEASEIKADGSLVAIVSGRELSQRPPVTWQIEADGTRRQLASSFRVLGENRFGFVVEGRDPSLPIVIDPILVYSEFIGGSNADVGRGVAVDESGAVYVTGWSKSADFPNSDARRRNGKDVVVFKLRPNGRDLEYVTFIGGRSDEMGHAIRVNEAGEVYVVGETRSSDFPTTRSVHSRARAGDSDAFALKLSADGATLQWSTFLGGSASDVAHGVALGADGTAYIVGTTRSRDFPVTSYAFQTERKGGRDAFVTRLDADGGLLIFSTYLGGVRDDEGYAIGLDQNGFAYVTGRTDSGDFPTTLGTHDGRKADIDAFVTKLGLAGSSLVYSTFVGGTAQDEALALAVDEDGQAWIGGWTQSFDIPVTVDAFQSENQGRRDGFIASVSTSGGTLSYASFVGGTGHDEVLGLALDAYGAPWVVGNTSSDDMPVSADAAQESRRGGRDAFLVSVDRASGRLGFGTYIGSRGHETAFDVAAQPFTENIVVVGQAENVPPTERGRLGGRTVGPSDALVARFEPGLCGARAERSTLGVGAGVRFETTMPRLGKTIELRVTDAPSYTQGYVLVSGPSATTTVLENLFELHVDPLSVSILFDFVTDENGTWTHEVTLPRRRKLCGRSFLLQVVTFDAEAGPLSFGQISEGLFLTLGD